MGRQPGIIERKYFLYQSQHDRQVKGLWFLALICLPLKSLKVTSGFGYRIHPLTGKFWLHAGTDLRAHHDTVFAIADGRVKQACTNKASGNYISIEHGGFRSGYAHLSKFLVARNEHVFAGQPIGITGATGCVTAEHLHFSIRYQGRSTDPLQFLYQILICKTMANNFKPLHEIVANKLISELKNGTSLLQKPVKDNGSPAFVTPVNANTGKGYSALNAINLANRGYDDPRWLSAKEASFSGYFVKEGAKGTLISFPKTSDIQAMRDHNGGKILDEEGKTQVRVVDYDKPQNATAFLFNASQINRITSLEEYLKETTPANDLSPIEKAAKLIANSNAVIVHGGKEAFYDKVKDEIHMPEKDRFENETAYYQSAVHQLVHWSGHESRLNRPMDGMFGSLEYGREEFRAALGAMIIGGELKLGHHFPHHAAYAGTWAKMLKDDPFQMSRASNDAQRAANLLLGVSRKQEQDLAPEEQRGFEKGEEIVYNDTTYKVLELRNNKSIKVENELGAKNVFKPTDGIYNSLLEAKYNAPKIETAITEQQEQEQTTKIGR
ncbi:zincin-like metallopeptidase domain-containing protein [Mucilaginibacter sp. SMC90]|uniref:zincin-like metallopeptidase domain-containing protein n=1 Tax=Mucilaginibacter sp. SMC90 TaxID=2929803 RepID=UPI001FB3F39A|nr:zincin-like metallopeptidase domain-containing protein [Mucilaginibacter sp. SMC90]UOE50925.1 zincin-like metallopeptidase domain-containing protein [Mucilaginibacter sp. SMC90]